MKRFFTLLFTLLFLTSCNFTEEISFNEDGSGEFVMTYDLAQVFEQMKEMGMGSANEEKEPEKMDSIMYFKDIIGNNKDSIASLPKDEQEKLKALENFMMKMNLDEEAGIFNIGIGSTFKNFNELPEIFENLEKAQKMNSKESSQFSQMNDSEVAKAAENTLEYFDYNYDGSSFTRRMKKNIDRSEADMESLNKEISEMGEAKEMFEAMSYTLLYKFPKKIKSVSNEDAVISDDGKSVRLKVNFIQMIKSPELMNLEVVLED